MKRLVVCCDGTWNTPDEIHRGAVAPTNVGKLALGVAPVGPDGTEQRLHYLRGVGTGRLDRLLGGAFGLGLSRHVREGYRFLVECGAPGDEVFLLGFSRGAYTARSLAGLIRNAGILRAEYADQVDAAYALYRSRDDATHPRGVEARLFRRMYARDEEPTIHFVGVWDTVGALGIPGIKGRLARRTWGFHDTTLSSRVRFAYHALAVDERRRPFAPTLWERAEAVPGQTLEQRWFAGCHSDVGGGFPDAGLAELPLRWMAGRARAAGLAFEPDHLREVAPDAIDPEARRAGTQIAPDPLGPIHPSRTAVYRLQPALVRDLAGPGGHAEVAVADTVVARRDGRADYRPENLAAYLAAGGPVTPLP
jgi:uncharacterized protein (DUF2235 family)